MGPFLGQSGAVLCCLTVSRHAFRVYSIFSLSALVAWKGWLLAACYAVLDSPVLYLLAHLGQVGDDISHVQYNIRYDCKASTQQPGRPKARTHALARLAATPRAPPRKSNCSQPIPRRSGTQDAFRAGDHVLSTHIDLGHGLPSGLGQVRTQTDRQSADSDDDVMDAGPKWEPQACGPE